MNEYQFLMNIRNISISHSDLIQLLIANTDHDKHSANSYIRMLYSTYQLHKIENTDNWLGSDTYMRTLWGDSEL